MGPVVPVFIDDTTDPWSPGGAQRWWLHHSLANLKARLNRAGLPLVLRLGNPSDIIDDLIRQTGAAGVVWNRRYDPHATGRDQLIKEVLRTRGLIAESFNAGLLHEPTGLRTATGTAFQVFTPFWRALMALGDPGPALPVPDLSPLPQPWPRSDNLEDWRLLPRRPDWSGGLRAMWQPGEAGARDRLTRWLDSARETYGTQRDRPDREATSTLSPHLHWGEISPRQVWHAVRQAMAAAGDDSGWDYLRQLGWREFSAYLLFHHRDLASRAFRPAFERFAWIANKTALKAWQRGRTGYPMVDAAMRQLWQTGWMHNRARMIVASFLTKHLMQDWRHGAAWFWDTLVDADLANNAAGWQWVAGCGADAAPYFRIFNPVLQGEKFDPDGTYVRRYVPELAMLPARWIHRPWEAPTDVLSAAGLNLGGNYPLPIVEHGWARARALAAFAAIKEAA
jgi:deoxyribodipyrimidine photo-lyase